MTTAPIGRAAHLDRHPVRDQSTRSPTRTTWSAPAIAPVRTSSTRPGGTTSASGRPSRVSVEPEQPLRLVVEQRDPAGRVDGDRALADAVQHRLALLEQRRDLVGLQPEGLALDPAREQDGRRCRRAAGRAAAGSAAPADRRPSRALTLLSSTPTETRPITRPRASRIGTFARIERPSEPGLGAHERLSGENRAGILARVVEQRLAEHLRVRVRVADPAPVRPRRRTHAPVARRIRSAIGSMTRAGLCAEKPRRPRGSTRPSARSRATRCPARGVEVCARVEEGDGEAAADRDEDDRQLEEDDLRREARRATPGEGRRTHQRPRS